MKSTHTLQKDDPFRKAALEFAKANPGKTLDDIALEQEREADERAKKHLKDPKVQAAFGRATSTGTPSEETSTHVEAATLERVVEQINQELAESVPFHFGKTGE